MLSKPNDSSSPGAGFRPLIFISSVRGRIILGVGVLVVTLLLIAAAAASLLRQHHTDLQQMEAQARSISLLNDVAIDSTGALYMLQSYVVTGDESLPGEIAGNLVSAGSALNEAIENEEALGNEERVSTLRSILNSSSSVPTAIQDIIETRRAGDIETASAEAAELNELQALAGVFQEAAAGAQDDLTAVRSRSERTTDLAVWLFIVAGSVGGLLALTASVLLARSIITPLSAVESAALVVAGGNLHARAPASGPRELAHLGQTLNQMLETVDDRTQELRQANEELKQRNKQLLSARTQAATDGLTGLANHRAFHEKARQVVPLAEKNGDNVGLIMLDVDGFKRVNDSLGHQAGDQVLRDVAAAINDVAGQDRAYRYGGDEFAVLLPNTRHDQAAEIAERIRRAAVEKTSRTGTRVTVSAGFCSFPYAAESLDELVYGADAAMYWAKSAGKNRVGDWSQLIRRRKDGKLPWYAADRGVKAPEAVAALTAALAAKDPITHSHTERCSAYALKLAEEIGLDEEELSIVRLSSLLHDVGKIAVPDEVLAKPGPLNEEEWAQMKQHPTTALHVLSQIRSLSDATPAILHHHEHYDGSGYPDGLVGDDIPMASRILLVTDAFDAMTTDRPYRKAMPVEHAIEELRRNSGSQFDPEVVEAFLKVIARDGTRLSAARPESREKSEQRA